MTPKEKAKELVDKFESINLLHYTDEAKQCALICVDEIINSLNNIESQHSTMYEEEDFWQEVKKEVKKQI